MEFMTVRERRGSRLRRIYCSAWCRFAVVFAVVAGGFAVGTAWSFAGSLGLLAVIDRAERRYLPETGRLPLIAFLTAACVIGLVVGVLGAVAVIAALALS